VVSYLLGQRALARGEVRRNPTEALTDRFARRRHRRRAPDGEPRAEIAHAQPPAETGPHHRPLAAGPPAPPAEEKPRVRAPVPEPAPDLPPLPPADHRVVVDPTDL